MENVNQIVSEWEQGAEMTLGDANVIYESLDSYLNEEFEEISELINSDPAAAFCKLVRMTNFISAAGRKVPGIITNFQKTINKYQALGKTLGKKLAAKSLTISVGFPWGVSVGLTWDI